MVKNKQVSRVIIVGHENYGAREIFTKIVQSHPDLEFGLILTTGLYYKKSFIQSIVKMLKEASFLFCFNRFIELIKYKIANDTLHSRAKKMHVPVCFSGDINGLAAHEYIKKFNTDIIISTFTMHVYNQATIDLPHIMSIGCHPSILPDYRGLEVFFWALANNEKSSGVSVFSLDRKIDAGNVLMQERFDITRDETVKSIYEKLTEIAGRLLSETLWKIKRQEKFPHISSTGKGSYYPMPTRACYKKFKATGKKWH